MTRVRGGATSSVANDDEPSSQISTKERTSKINNAPTEEENHVPPPSHCTFPSYASRKGICTSGNDQNSGSGLSGGIGGNEEAEVILKGEALSEIDEKNTAVTVGGETSEDSNVAVQQQSQSKKKNGQSRGAGSNTSLVASSNCNLKDGVKVLENREKTKENDEAVTTKIERSSEKLDINKEEVASERLKGELQELSVNNAESQDDNHETTSVLTVPKEEKIAAAAESNVIDNHIKPVNKKDNSSCTTTGTKNESLSYPNNHVQFMNDGSSNKESSSTGDAAGQRLKLQGATSVTDSGDGDSVSVDKEGRTATDHNGMDMVVVNAPPPKQQKLFKRKRRYSGLEMSSTATPSSPPCLQTTATADHNSIMNCDAVENVAARSADADINDDCDLHLRKAGTDKHASAPAQTQKETTSSETENTGNCSRSSVPPNSKKVQQEASSSVNKEQIDSCTSESIDGIISNKQQQHSGGEILDINDQTSPVNQQQLKAGKGSMEGTTEEESTTHDFAAHTSKANAESEEMGTTHIICNKLMKRTENGPPLVSSDVTSQRRKAVSTMNGFPNGNGKSAGDHHQPPITHSLSFVNNDCVVN